MGNGGSSLGKKISEGFNVIGKKMGEGWEATKNFGNKAWNSIKSVPVLGTIASGIEKYTPIGMAATSALRAIDAGVGGTSKLFQGDVKGAASGLVKAGAGYLASKGGALGTVAGLAEKVL